MSLLSTAGSAADVGSVDIGRVLFHILVVLVAAKLAAELAERARIPAVLGEIVAGVVIGPSVLNLVNADEVLFVLGELGVILLLLDVGLQMDLAELSRVGRASMAVALTGVVAPFAAGTAAGVALGHDVKTSVFLGAALTATSVGITARVFGDLGTLSTVESRIVLGAAVADDVLGLVILTVVVRVVVDGSVNVVTVLGITGLAIAFLLVTGTVGTRVAPPLFAAVQRFARSPSTLVAVAFAFTMGFSALANAAKLAPIIGAFMAGLAMGRSHHAERIAREITPIGHVFIPVFFLSIGIKADVRAMAHPSVLGLAAVLTGVAIAGKLVSAAGAFGTRSDKWMIGIGMIPRGEVGLIFATLGLRNGVLDEDLYAAVIMVVLVTTLITPPLLRWKTVRAAAATGAAASVDREPAEPPPGGWLVETDDVIELRGDPPGSEVLPLALDAAARAVTSRPSNHLLDWFAAHRTQPLAWDTETTRSLIVLLRQGTPRSWRLLETLGVLERALPEVSAALRSRRADPAELDPTRVLRFPTIDRINELSSDASTDVEFVAAFKQLDRTDPLVLAALVMDLAGPGGDPGAIARSVYGQLSISDSVEREAAALVNDALLLRAAAREFDVFDPHVVMQLAAHVGNLEALHGLYLLSVASGPQDEWQRSALNELTARVAQELGEGRDTNVCDARREAAQRLADDPAVAERIAHAPRSYILANEPDELARQARLAEPPPRPGTARVAVTGDATPDHWRIDVACQDRTGLLARIAVALTDTGLDIVNASVATWADGAAVDSFIVQSTKRPTARALAEAIERSLRTPLAPRPLPGAAVRFDNVALPWHTSCTVETDDHPGVLAAISTAFAMADVAVHSARISTSGGVAVDRFSVTERSGRKLDDITMARVRRALEGERSRRALR